MNPRLISSIANIEDIFQNRTAQTINQQQALGRVLATAMDKGVEIRKTFGVLSPGRWSDDAITFVAKTEFASTDELSKVMNFSRPALKEADLPVARIHS